MVTPQSIQSSIEHGLACDVVEVAGDGHHFEALIVSPAFRGLSRVARHRLVYAALGERMREEIHALSMVTLTPEEQGPGARGQAPGSVGGK
jgi:acid stress-induced BolA-like protein IbaG/YrbA